MTKRRKRKQESSGTLTTVFEIMFGGIAGAAVAAIWLVLKPVQITDSPPRDADEPPARHAVDYRPGKLGLVRESQVRIKERAVMQQSDAEVSLSEQEINRWLVTRFGASTATDVLGLGIEMRPEPPIVRMAGEEMQVGVVYSFSGYDTKKNMVLQATGHFDRMNSGNFEFVPAKAYLGSCPLPSGFVSRFVLKTFLSGFAVSDELKQAWSGLRDVVLGDGNLKLRFGGAVPAVASKPEPARGEAAVAADVQANIAADVSDPEETAVETGLEEKGNLIESAEETVDVPNAPAASEEAEPAPAVAETPLVDSASTVAPGEDDVVEESAASLPSSDEVTEEAAEPETDTLETASAAADSREEAPAGEPADSN